MFKLWKFIGTTYTDKIFLNVKIMRVNKCAQIYVAYFSDLSVYMINEWKKYCWSSSMWFLDRGITQQLNYEN